MPGLLYRNILVLLAFSLLLSFGCTGLKNIGGANASACGNKILEGSEQCELGAACSIANMTCNMTDCTCRMPGPIHAAANYSCASNSKMVENGVPNSFDATTMQCRDDCRNTTPGTVCDPKTCTCRAAGQTLGCVANTLLVNVANVNLFVPGMMCIDDCLKIDPAMKCNANCVCTKAPPPQLACAANTKTVATGAANTFNAAIVQCKDDCKNTDPTLTCDPVTCTCTKAAGLTCMQNTVGVAFGNKNEFNPFGGQCRDDCNTIDPDMGCDPATCLCELPKNYTPPSSIMPCTVNTMMLASNVSLYDPSEYKCEDNCDKLWSGYVCNPSSCTCKPGTGVSFDCSARTVPGQTTREKVPVGTMCSDDCVAKFGAGYTCDSLSCTCVAPGTYPEYSCSDNSLNIITVMSVAYPLPPHYQCKDDCNESGQNLACDPQRCVCVPPTAAGTVSCARRDFETAYNGGKIPPIAAGQCKDDCGQFYGEKYYCDANCTCQRTPQTQKTASCASRQLGSSALPAGTQCRDDCKDIYGANYSCDASCTCQYSPPQTPPAVGKCGDGMIVSPEQCDPGSYDTNKCPQGTYCKNCACTKLETSVVCGDGKISSPGEDCDGGSVTTNICQDGYTCKLCKCVASSTVAQCGDGRVTPPEECDIGNTYTAECPGGNTCHSCRCIPYGNVPQETHKECSGSYCVSVQGSGSDKCSSDSQCTAAAPTHKICSGSSCVTVSGSGSNECSSDSQCTQTAAPYCGDGTVNGNEQCEADSDCRSGYVCSSCMCIQKPAQCGDGTVNGNEECDPKASPSGCDEPAKCGSNCKCISPPSLNCDQICGYTSGAQSFPGVFTAESCASTVKGQFGTRTCYLTCAYAYLYKVTNIAGSGYCCCGMKKEFQCSDCPGQNPQCPDQSTCDRNAPSWYQQ